MFRPGLIDISIYFTFNIIQCSYSIFNMCVSSSLESSFIKVKNQKQTLVNTIVQYILSDPHIEELYIIAELGNTKLMISNVYIPPASSCSNIYQSSIEHLLTTPDTLILDDFNAHHPSLYSRSTDTTRRKMADSINGAVYGILKWDIPTRFRQMQNRVRQMFH